MKLKEIWALALRISAKDGIYEFVKFFENDVLPTMRRELRAIGVPLLDEDDKGNKK